MAHPLGSVRSTGVIPPDLTPVNVAPVKFADWSSTFLRVAPERSAPDRLAALRSAPVRSTPGAIRKRLATFPPVGSEAGVPIRPPETTFVNTAVLKFVPVTLASVSLLPVRSEPDRSKPDRSTPDRSTPDRSTPEVKGLLARIQSETCSLLNLTPGPTATSCRLPSEGHRNLQPSGKFAEAGWKPGLQRPKFPPRLTPVKSALLRSTPARSTFLRSAFFRSAVGPSRNPERTAQLDGRLTTLPTTPPDRT